MRTLKKVLALTVVLATVFSLTAFAAFTDADQINESCQDDINLMNALNVMVGDAEGTFRPNGTISRAEAAKMVYVVRNGGVDDKASGWTGMKVFNDVPAGAWYEGYVNYCASLGIIAGVGGNKFNPDGAVTGVELAKMMLVVADYKPDVEGYTGANWSLNVIDDAQQANMFEGYSIAFSASAPRQWAAKLFSNAILKTQTAVYFNGERINGSAFMGQATTVGQKYFSLQTRTGVLQSNYYASLEGGLGNRKVSEIELTTTVLQGESEGDALSFAYNVPASLLGQEVTVVYKESGDKASLDAKDTVFDVYATGASNVVTTTRDAATISTEAPKELKLAGVNNGRAVTYTDSDDITVLTNGGLTLTMVDISAISDATGWANLFDKSNENVTLILDDDNKIEYAIIDNVNYGFISKIDLDKGQFELRKADKTTVIPLKNETGLENGGAGNNLTFGNTEAGKQRLADYLVVPNNLEAGNLVRYTASIETGHLVYTFEGMTPAVSGAMTVRADDNKSATIAGTAYALGKAAADLGFIAMPDIAAKENYNVFTDGKYAIYVTSDSGATANVISSNMAYVIAKTNPGATDEWNTAADKVDVLLANGTRKVFNYAAKPASVTDAVYLDFGNGDDVASEFEADTVVEYVLVGEDSIYFRTFSYSEEDHDDVDYTAAVNDEFSEANQRFGAYPVNDNSYFFFADTTNKEYKVVKAADLKDGAELEDDVSATVTVSGIPTVAFGICRNLGSTSGTAAYAFVTSAPVKAVVNDEVVDAVSMTLSTGEEIQTAVIKEGTPANGGIYKVTPVDGKYNFEDETLADGELIGSNTGFAMINVTDAGTNAGIDAEDEGTNTFNINDDTQIFYIDASGETAKLTDPFDLSTQDVKLAVDSKGNIVVMYVTAADEGDGENENTIDALTVSVPELKTDDTLANVDLAAFGLDAAGVELDGAITWTNIEDNTTADTKAKFGKTYKAVFSVTAADPKAFAGTVAVTVGDGDAEDATPADGKVEITVTGITVAAADIKLSSTNKLTLSATKPAAGDATLPIAPTTPGITSIKVTVEGWYSDDTCTTEMDGTNDTFTNGNDYYVKLKLEANAGYVLDETTFTAANFGTPTNATIQGNIVSTAAVEGGTAAFVTVVLKVPCGD